MMNGIKYIREKSNISKSELAGRMGVTRQSVTLWESGKRKPGTKHLKRWGLREDILRCHSDMK